MATRINFAHPFLHVQDNIAWANNGDILKCYRADLPEIYSLSEKDFDAIYDGWYRGAKNLNAKTILFKQDVFLKDRFNASGMPGTNYFQRATRQHFHGRDFMNHWCYVFFIYTDTGVLKNAYIQNPFRPLPNGKSVWENLKKIDELFHRETDQIVEFVNSQRKILLVPMLKEEIIRHAQNYFNGYYTDRTTDAEKKAKHYQIGNRMAGAFVVKSLKQIQRDTIVNTVVDPKMSTTDYQFHRGYADALGLTLTCDHVYNQVFFITDHHTTKASIAKNQGRLYGARELGADNKVGAELLKDYLEKEVAQDEKIKFIQSHFNVIYFAETETDFKLFDGQIASTFKDMDIVPYFPTGNNLANIINNSYPAHISNLDRGNVFTFDMQMALCMMANVTNYKDDPEGIYFNDRLTNVPKRKDTWDRIKKRIKARNFFVTAPTGEGKSFLLNHILRQFIEDQIILVINDLGDSYIKLCKLFPEISLYIKYKHGEPLGVNPMFLPPGETLTITQLNSVVEFIKLLWKRENVSQMTTEQTVSLRTLLKTYYEQVPKNHSFPSFYEFIKLNKASILSVLNIDEFFFPIDEFLHVCSEFVDDGAYGFLFRDKANFDIRGKRIVVFEFDEAKEDPLLLSILLMMSSEATRQLCWLDRSERGIVLFDEFAKFLKYPNVLGTVQYYYQAARKQECAIGTVLQTPSQLPENDTAKSIIDNTQVYYILPNSKGYAEIIDKFKMSSHAKNQMMSMSSNFSGKIKYSEFYLQLGNEGNVMRLEVPKEVYCAYLTEGAEHETIMKLFAKTNNMEKAIEEYLSTPKQAAA